MARVCAGWRRLGRVCAARWPRSLLAAAILAVATAPSAQAFDPAFQSGRGACSQDTQSVAQAVGDLHANGVLAAYARTIGVAARESSLNKALGIGVVKRGTVTANHGCDGLGNVFPVGARTLHAGETVGVKLPPRLRACAPRAAGCRAVTIVVHVVFPTNCWNVNTGTISVLVYVHRGHRKPKAKPKPKVARPAVSTVLSCTAGGVVVILTNGASATAPAPFEVNGVDYGPLAPGASTAVTVPVAVGTTNYVTVSSGHQMLINLRPFTNTCATAPSTVPSASAALSCSAGGVVLTLANGAAATEPASFSVNGTAYGPVAPGGSATATVTVAQGATANITVTSGDQTLIANQPYTNNCVVATPAPNASSALMCSIAGGGTLTVTLSNASTATAPASFTVSATGNAPLGFGPSSYGPLAPGATQAVMIPVDTSGNDVAVTVTSAGTTIFTQTYTGGCPFTE